uniref:Uncharacterized protein n=1 Tax=Oryctolagus cuniculus TaxID=9986 RepID=A0A5F9CGG5_RABIT
KKSEDLLKEMTVDSIMEKVRDIKNKFNCEDLTLELSLNEKIFKGNVFILFYFLTEWTVRERETERKVFLLPLVHLTMTAAAAHRTDPMAGARYLSWSPMGCRAQALGPSSTALPGHSRELAWKRGNRDRIRRPDRD